MIDWDFIFIQYLAFDLQPLHHRVYILFMLVTERVYGVLLRVRTTMDFVIFWPEENMITVAVTADTVTIIDNANIESKTIRIFGIRHLLLELYNKYVFWRTFCNRSIWLCCIILCLHIIAILDVAETGHEGIVLSRTGLGREEKNCLIRVSRHNYSNFVPSWR